MRRYVLMVAVAAAAATLTGFAPADGALAGAAAPGSAPAGPAAAGRAAAPGAQLWVARFRSNGYANAHGLAVSPDGSRVFVTGEGYGRGTSGRNYATVAYSAATGRQLWVQRYSGNARYGIDIASSVAVSPGGGRVFVTGSSPDRGTGDDYATLAYNAVTGRQLWVSRYNGPGNKADDASSVAVSPAGTTVFVTGSSGDDDATVAYSAATGRQLWASRYHGPQSGLDFATSVAVSPSGGKIFVTGWSWAGRAAQYDYGTVAYSAATGRQLWVSRYSHPEPPNPSNLGATASSVAVGPGGTMVFVTGSSWGGRKAGQDYATVAYSARTGRQLWVSRYRGGFAHKIAVSPDGTMVYVTGEYAPRAADYYSGYATVAYNAATGKQLWARIYSNATASSLAVSPDGTTVYVTGGLNDYATVAYGAATGSQLWATSYNGPAGNGGSACCVAVSPDGTTVYVTGYILGQAVDWATIAYRG